MTAKKSKSNLATIKKLFIGVLIGLIIGIVGTLFVINHNPTDNKRTLDASIVFDRIVAQDELVCASQTYNITEKATSSARFFDIFDIPFTENSFWYRYVGTIKVGVNLKEAVYSTSGSTITVELNQPYIISNTPDMSKSGCLEERGNIFNPIHVEDVDAFQQQCIEQSEEEISAGGIFDEAKINAEQNISDMFYAALGDAYTIEFKWRDTAE